MRRPALALALLLGVVGASTQLGSTASNDLPAETTAVYRSTTATGATLLSTGYTVTAGQITGVSPRLRGLLALKTVTAQFGSGLPVVCTPGVFTVLDVVTGLREATYTCIGLLEDADRPGPLRITAS